METRIHSIGNRVRATLRTGCIFATLGFFALQCQAAGYSTSAVPTRIDVVRNQGLLIVGAFGNPSGCTSGDSLFLPMSVTQYKEMYAMLLTALAAGKAVSMYTRTCTPLSFYSAGSVTYNTVSDDDFVLHIEN